jgi:hypothetical protein
MLPNLKSTGALMAARQILLEPAIIVIDNDPDFASAEAWFYGLDKVFKTLIPYKAVRYPYRLSKLGTALATRFRGTNLPSEAKT